MMVQLLHIAILTWVKYRQSFFVHGSWFMVHGFRAMNYERVLQGDKNFSGDMTPHEL